MLLSKPNNPLIANRRQSDHQQHAQDHIDPGKYVDPQGVRYVSYGASHKALLLPSAMLHATSASVKPPGDDKVIVCMCPVFLRHGTQGAAWLQEPGENRLGNHSGIENFVRQREYVRYRRPSVLNQLSGPIASCGTLYRLVTNGRTPVATGVHAEVIAQRSGRSRADWELLAETSSPPGCSSSRPHGWTGPPSSGESDCNITDI